jgi:hypothetical protein
VPPTDAIALSFMNLEEIPPYGRQLVYSLTPGDQLSNYDAR